MLVLGHVGITLGITLLVNGTFHRSRSLPAKADEETRHPGHWRQVPSGRNSSARSKLSWISVFAGQIDIRILLLGSLIPDIIDKPIGHFFFRDTISSGRIISHTLLFLILITIAGLYLYQRRRRMFLLVVAFGTFTHLIFDQMWRLPQTLFWPIYGFTFERRDVTGWITNILYALLTNPEVYVPELIGAAVLAWFALTLVRKKKVFYFLKYGQVP